MKPSEPTANNPAACVTAEQRALWSERLLDTIDELSTAADRQSLAEHLQACAHCRDTWQMLTATDANLREQLSASSVPRAPAAGFDARLIARIAITDRQTRAAKCQREASDHQTQLRQLKSAGRRSLGRMLSHSLGAIATLAVAVGTGFPLRKIGELFGGERQQLVALIHNLGDNLGFSLVPVAAVFLSMAIAVLAIGLTRRGDQRLR